MAVLTDQYCSITRNLEEKKVTLIAVSKTKSVDQILELYYLGQRDFGENYVQELLEKQQALPKDIRWHFIGHLQTNKVKLIAPFIHLIQSVDSKKLLVEINKQGIKNNRIINCLLQVYIAKEETKYGLDKEELEGIFSRINIDDGLKNVKLCGMMGMASFSANIDLVRNEFRELKTIFDKYNSQYLQGILSMGMSSDYNIAIEEGSNMVRIGSLFFGTR